MDPIAAPCTVEPRQGSTGALGIASLQRDPRGPVPHPCSPWPGLVPGRGGGSLHPPVPFVSLRKIDLEARWKSPAANRVRRCLTAAPRGST